MKDADDVRRVTTVAALRRKVANLRAQGSTVAFVPTMGALHEGHLSLVRLAAAHADAVVVSVFVNPLQFDRAADLETYPRDLAADEAALSGLSMDTPLVVFAPTAVEVYPKRPPSTTVRVAGLTERLCGATRPGHFDGVATVVTKLLNIVQPDVAVFGRKDRQQLEVVRRLVSDLNLPVGVIDAPTLRDPDGVAVSSRNALLTADERQLARAIPDALAAAVLAARDARRRRAPITPGLVSSAAAATLRQATCTPTFGAPDAGGDQRAQPGSEAPPRFVLDYLEVVDPTTLTAPVEPTGQDSSTGDKGGTGGRPPLLIAIAAFVGSVRLIDNVEIGHADDEQRVLAHLASGPHASSRVGLHQGRRTAGREG